MKHPKVAEYRDIPTGLHSRVTVLTTASGPNPSGYVRSYTLSHHTAGYECAGSMARWTDERWSVLTFSDGASHGRSFLTREAAHRCLVDWTTPESVGVA